MLEPSWYLWPLDCEVEEDWEDDEDDWEDQPEYDINEEQPEYDESEYGDEEEDYIYDDNDPEEEYDYSQEDIDGFLYGTDSDYIDRWDSPSAASIW